MRLTFPRRRETSPTDTAIELKAHSRLSHERNRHDRSLYRGARNAAAPPYEQQKLDEFSLLYATGVDAYKHTNFSFIAIDGADGLELAQGHI